MPTILSENIFRSLSWSFLHSLWQGLALSVLAGLVMLMTRKTKSALRYTLLCSLFFLFIATVLATFFLSFFPGNSGSGNLSLSSGPSEADHFFGSDLVNAILPEIGSFLESNSSWIVMVWGVIILLKSAILLLDMIYVRRLRTCKVSRPGKEWEDRIKTLAEEIGIRKSVRLLESRLVKVPIVLNHFKPVILVPLGVLTNLGAGEVESVLLHELAHIRRHDYLVNFLQRMTEMVFFFNPGLLWVSSLLREEREHCCDDIAIAKTKNKLQFVEALISFKEQARKNEVLALGLFGRKNLLLQRMTRIVYNRNKTLTAFESTFLMLNAALLMLLVSTAWKPVPSADAVPVSSQTSVAAPGITPQRTALAGSIVPAAKDTLVPGARPAASRTATRRTLPGREPVNSTRPLDLDLQADATEKADRAVSSAAERSAREKELEWLEQEQKLALEHRMAIERDQALAQKHQEQVDLDRERAQVARERAEKDKIEAAKNRLRASHDRLLAEKDRQRAIADRERAARDREHAAQNRERARMKRENELKKRNL